MKILWYNIKYLFNDEEITDNDGVLITKARYNSLLSEKWLYLSDSIWQLEEINKLEKENDLLKEQVNTLLNDGLVDVNELKEWYEAKYGDKIWKYNYDNKGLKDVKYALRVKNSKPLIALAKEIIEYYNIGPIPHPGSVVEAVIKYFTKRKNWIYMHDIKKFKTIEYWQIAEKSAVDREGDCDDLAILMHNVIYYAFKQLGISDKYWRLKLTAGGTLVEAHAFNIWLHDDGNWYAVESTLDLIGSWKKTWLKTPIKNNNLYSKYYGFARKDRSWQGTTSSLDRYEKKIETEGK